jgi:hypothetical protein
MDMDKNNARVFAMSFGSVYPLYVQKAEKKGRTKAEVDEVIMWLTGYTRAELARIVSSKVDFATFFAQAPQLNPNVQLITGVVCGVRIEDIADPLMKKIRYLDKLIDELAKGRPMERILRQQTDAKPAARTPAARKPAARKPAARTSKAAARKPAARKSPTRKSSTRKASTRKKAR